MRTQRLRFSVVARIKDTIIAADKRSGGMFPLIANCKDLLLKAILEAYKFQPKLKKVSRIEALLFLYFIALLVHALLERECKAPSTERVLDVFAPVQRHRLRKTNRLVQIFEPELSDLHRQILDLIRLTADVFQSVM